MPDIKDEVQRLISEGQIDEALELLASATGDAVLQQGRYNNGKKQYNMGLIDFNEWQRVQAQVSYAALELAKSLKKSAAPSATTSTPAPAFAASGGNKKVFISYSQLDSAVALQARDFLASKGIDVIIDQDDLQVGISIMDFIQESIRQADAVLSIVSSQSLQSGWVGQESVASMYAVWLADRKFIPVRLDNLVFDIDFQIAAQESILQKIQDLDAKIEKLRQLGGDPRAFSDDRNRLFELKNNLGQIIQRLKSVNVADISGDQFQTSMQKVLDRIGQF